MSKVIDITPQLKARKQEREEEKLYSKHDQVLDLCDELFHQAIIVEIDETGNVRVSCNFAGDSDLVVASLAHAALTIKDESEK